MASRQATTAQRGYGGSHTALRRQLAPVIAEGQTNCTRCGHLIQPGQAWHLDHDDHDRTRYLGAAHARCNTRAGGRKGGRLGAMITNSRHARLVQSRQW